MRWTSVVGMESSVYTGGFGKSFLALIFLKEKKIHMTGALTNPKMLTLKKKLELHD